MRSLTRVVRAAAQRCRRLRISSLAARRTQLLILADSLLTSHLPSDGQRCVAALDKAARLQDRIDALRAG